MVIRLAAVEGDQFSSNAGEQQQHKNELYEPAGNQGPTDLSTAANIQ